MEVNIYEAKTNLSKIIQSLVDKNEEEVIISKNGKPIVKMTLINNKKEHRVGVAKGKLSDFNYDDFESINICDLF